MTMPHDSRPQSPESARRAALHRVIGALNTQLEKLACSHQHTIYTSKLCELCLIQRARISGVVRCVDCGRPLCEAHARMPAIYRKEDTDKYYRLRSKISRLERDLTQGSLFHDA
jgi:formylmethanofuran dehydrogenase subunit E